MEKPRTFSLNGFAELEPEETAADAKSAAPFFGTVSVVPGKRCQSSRGVFHLKGFFGPFLERNAKKRVEPGTETRRHSSCRLNWGDLPEVTTIETIFSSGDWGLI